MVKAGELIPRANFVKDEPFEVRLSKGTELELTEGRNGTYYLATVETRDGVRIMPFSNRLVNRLLEVGLADWVEYHWVKITRIGEGFDTDYDIVVEGESGADSAPTQ